MSLDKLCQRVFTLFMLIDITEELATTPQKVNRERVERTLWIIRVWYSLAW